MEKSGLSGYPMEGKPGSESRKINALLTMLSAGTTLIMVIYAICAEAFPKQNCFSAIQYSAKFPVAR